MPQWLEMMKTADGKGIQFFVSLFDEQWDAEFVKMRMAAILE
jgi:hypothetical protein